MLPMDTPTEHALGATDAALRVFTQGELSLLMSVEATMAAERYLVPLGERCPDHQACRRFAFGLWLRLTRRVGEGIDG